MSWLTDMSDTQLLGSLADVRAMTDVTPGEKELALANLHREFHRRGLGFPYAALSTDLVGVQGEKEHE